MKNLFYIIILLGAFCNAQKKDSVFKITDQQYLKNKGVEVMLAHDFYPEGHQGGVGIIQNGIRVATNGDLRLEPTPGQWQPVPKVGERSVDLANQTINLRMQFPDSSKNRTGFNPVEYPDLYLAYTLKIKPEGKSFKIIVDLDKPLPAEWVGKVGFNLEFFPGILFGKSYYMDDEFGIFNRQANGPGYTNEDNEYRMTPIASGKKLSIAPEMPEQSVTIQNVGTDNLELLDGRAQHNNGWFIVRSLIPANTTKNAIEWIVSPNMIQDFIYDPVVQISQVGYHTNQDKVAVIETDPNDTVSDITLHRIMPDGSAKTIETKTPKSWGNFLRYKYFQYDFSKISEPGVYYITYKNYTTSSFIISETIYDRNVWQPTLEYFLPVQMCHMRINDRYKVWHGRCHLDDALMAPTSFNHFDGYLQGDNTLTSFKSGEHVPELDKGGWHDAGDFDLRIESQAETVQGLARIYELFDVNYDNTLIDQKTKTVEMLSPDGKADMLQQIEHGLLSIVGGYESLDRFYRGVIVPTQRQYVLLGDPLNHSDNEIYQKNGTTEIPMGQDGAPDDRWVFTEDNPERAMEAAAALATAARSMKDYNNILAKKCTDIAKKEWDSYSFDPSAARIELATELYHTTKDEKYLDYLIDNKKYIAANFANVGWIVATIYDDVDNKRFKKFLLEPAMAYAETVKEQANQTPYGVPYEPNIWGAGWDIQNFGMKQYFYHTAFPEYFPKSYMLNALNFVLGTHPGVNTASFVSGVGAHSLTQAYGLNRGERSYIPGGIGSGTALIRPDLPELLEWPYLWQQTEYVLGGGTTDYLFLAIAAQHLLK
ncbi:N-terminal ig-like domain of cellulase [Pustulibacterium marinum]|uniref:N-terminal ig-like domain of cellulase n=1 Tax=Pustulibacterium marinum TaxID=1224947 RepID=A0A1I7GFJ5_9FLAO|nr:glycoside hydrolase family 9 protein [Pustulibacterium marinum]SFU47229.1 N-terminal ig-like domain of cellulase [Pustulibacterium marinum]